MLIKLDIPIPPIGQNIVIVPIHYCGGHVVDAGGYGFEECKTGERTEHGEWISEMVDGEDWKGCKRQYYQPISCSKCHSPNYYKSPYCPNCGKKMGETDEQNVQHEVQ